MSGEKAAPLMRVHHGESLANDGRGEDGENGMEKEKERRERERERENEGVNE